MNNHDISCQCIECRTGMPPRKPMADKPVAGEAVTGNAKLFARIAELEARLASQELALGVAVGALKEIADSHDNPANDSIAREALAALGEEQ